jgi:cytochrome P450
LGNRHREFYPLLGDGIFTLDGAGWSHARALLRPQFTRDQVCWSIESYSIKPS